MPCNCVHPQQTVILHCPPPPPPTVYFSYVYGSADAYAPMDLVRICLAYNYVLHITHYLTLRRLGRCVRSTGPRMHLIAIQSYYFFLLEMLN
jgi:hypothetical protein